eukprot:3505943-Rhodomonas_salina.1
MIRPQTPLFCHKEQPLKSKRSRSSRVLASNAPPARPPFQQNPSSRSTNRVRASLATATRVY